MIFIQFPALLQIIVPKNRALWYQLFLHKKVRLSVDISLMQIHCTQVNPSYFIFLHHELLRDATYMQLQQMHINIFLGSLLRILF